ncbi:TPA: hypothetical protein NR037_000122 [Legionella pneumophila]|nr:hypothetical protein [Legionella pneumophila]
MSNNLFFDRKIQIEHLKKIKEIAGVRYTPKLNIELPIGDIFDSLCRTEIFYKSIQQHYSKLNREFSHVSSKFMNNELQKKYMIVQKKIIRLSKLLKELKKYNIKTISWIRINKRSSEAVELIWKFIERLNVEKSKNEKQKLSKEKIESFEPTIHFLYETLKEVRYFENFSSSSKAQLSNHPFLLLTGAAGTGKTHLLCDVLEHRINNGFFSILTFGEFFTEEKEPLLEIAKDFNKKFDGKIFLEQINCVAKRMKTRLIIAIDALNETKQKNFWKRKLLEVIQKIKTYPNLALVISVRNGFEDQVIGKKVRRKLVHIEHRGFEFKEWEAVNKFFGEFNIPLPEIPLLLPEFQNPLFLHLFCKAFQRRSKSNQSKKPKQIFKGHEGATYIFESYVDKVSEKIAKKFKISNLPRQNIWDTVIEKIASKMVDQNNDVISEEELTKLIRDEHPEINIFEFITELGRNLLLVKVPKYSNTTNDVEAFYFKFPFQKFSDHLIGRYIFKRYEREYGRSNKNLNTIKNFLSKRRRLGRFLAAPQNRGIIEALSVQCPEQLRGIELIEAAPYLKYSSVGVDAYIESIIWRKPSAFSESTKSSLGYINSVIIKTKSYQHSLLNAFLSIASVPEHPFNADFLHKHLSKFSMANRDAWWSTFLHDQYGEKLAVDRIIEWSLSEQDKLKINEDSIRLCSVVLSWFLTTSNKPLRDKATKALVKLLRNRLNLMLLLLKLFSQINEPYISERLYGIAYACAIYSRSDTLGLKELSLWVYEEIFKKKNPPTHILIRDYARGIINIALNEKIQIIVDTNNICPPYSSAWPSKIPSEKLLKNKYYNEHDKEQTESVGYRSIWSSVMHNYGTIGDFGNYVVNSAVRHWCGEKLKSKKTSRYILLKKFISDLSELQKNLFKKATSPFLDIAPIITFSNTDSGISINIDQHKKSIKEIKQALIDFKSSLSSPQKDFFVENIKPLLNISMGIKDSCRQFNEGLAQRWILNRVIQLGWKPELHGKFDKNVNFNRGNRHENKYERIGKKYQWIALYEFLGMISDHFLLQQNFEEPLKIYDGPWFLNIRNIDPTFTITKLPGSEVSGLPSFIKHRSSTIYKIRNNNLLDLDWLHSSRAIPDPQKLISYIDDQNNKWLILNSHYEWFEETSFEIEKYNIPRRNIWYSLRSYLIKQEDKEKVLKWAAKQNFFGRWMPESSEFSEPFLGEYPWAPSFLHYSGLSPAQHKWVKNADGRELPASFLITNDEYYNSGPPDDCSIDELVRIQLPAEYLIHKEELVQPYVDGCFYDLEGNLFAFDPHIFDKDMPHCLLVKKDKFCNFLDKNNLSIIWTVLGEKRLIANTLKNNHTGCLVINGVYFLDNVEEITGSCKTKMNAFD